MVVTRPVCRPPPPRAPVLPPSHGGPVFLLVRRCVLAIWGPLHPDRTRLARVLAPAQPVPLRMSLSALVQLPCCCCRSQLSCRSVCTCTPGGSGPPLLPASRVSLLFLWSVVAPHCCAAKHTSHAETRVCPLGPTPAAPAAHCALPVFLLCGALLRLPVHAACLPHSPPLPA